MVKISSEFIYSPVVETPTFMIIMNMPSYIKFLKKLIPQKFLFLNSSLIEEIDEIKNILKKNSKELEIVKINATEIANKIGSTVVSNIVMLAALAKKTNIVNVDTIKKVLSKVFNKNVLDMNLKALDYGVKSV